MVPEELTPTTFLGGPWDLHRVMLKDTDLERVYQVPVMARNPMQALVYPEAKNFESRELTEFETAMYHLEVAEIGSKKHYIYMFSGLKSGKKWWA